MADRYKTYIFKGIMRVRGPGLDIIPQHFSSPNTLAWALSVAYLEGFRAGKKSKAKSVVPEMNRGEEAFLARWRKRQ